MLQLQNNDASQSFSDLPLVAHRLGELNDRLSGGSEILRGLANRIYGFPPPVPTVTAGAKLQEAQNSIYGSILDQIGRYEALLSEIGETIDRFNRLA